MQADEKNKRKKLILSTCLFVVYVLIAIVNIYIMKDGLVNFIFGILPFFVLAASKLVDIIQALKHKE